MCTDTMEETVRALQRGSEPSITRINNIRDPVHHYTLLHLAIIYGANTKYFENLLKAGADWKQKIRNGMDAVQLAAAYRCDNFLAAFTMFMEERALRTEAQVSLLTQQKQTLEKRLQDMTSSFMGTKRKLDEVEESYQGLAESLRKRRRV